MKHFNVLTDPVPPVQITVSDVSTETASLQFETAAGEVQTYTVTCSSEERNDQETIKDTDKLKLGVCYSLQVHIQLKDGRISDPAVTPVCTSK